MPELSIRQGSQQMLKSSMSMSLFRGVTTNSSNSRFSTDSFSLNLAGPAIHQ